MFYKFEKELEEAVVVARPNRFIMEIIIDGRRQKAHCPVTGRIEQFDFKNTPCLVSSSDDKKRKTKFTVEAISLNKPEAKRKSWIGINQGKTNAYVEYFLRKGYFNKMIRNGEVVTREKKLGNSRIDFKIKNNFIEVKTFLERIAVKNKKPQYYESKGGMLLERLIKHFTDLGKYAKERKGKAIVLLCYVYSAEKFIPPSSSKTTKIGKTVRRAIGNGVENWQVNLKINKKGVYFLDYFKLKLF